MSFKLLHTILCILFIYPSLVFSQNQFRNWVFGENAGIRFVNGDIEPINGVALQSLHGTASFSDENGNLLFYSNGETIWNQNHEVMENGADLNGDPAVTHSALIVPLPGSNSIYYVFTLGKDCLQGVGYSGYQIVDMSMNGGLGSVVERNQYLHSAHSEKITAIPHANGEDYWIISLLPPVFKMKVYLLDENGINSNILSFDIDESVSTFCPGTVSGYGSIGYIKASSDGTKLAMANFVDGIVALYSFNSFTGEVFDEKILPVGSHPYGIEFSPNSRYLYVSFHSDTSLDEREMLRQYDTSLPDEISIFESERDIISSNEANYLSDDAELGALQLGPDDNIYVATTGQQKISVISNPNNVGSSSGFKAEVVDIGSGTSQFGLPMFFYRKTVSDLTWGNSCSGEETSFQLIGSQFSDITWDFGDGSEPVFNSTESTIRHVYVQAGTYTITVNFTDYYGEEKSIIKEIEISALPVQNENVVYTRESEFPGIIVDKPEMDLIMGNGLENVTFSYHYTLEEAIQKINLISPPNMTFHDGTYYSRATNEYTGCYSIVPFEVEVSLIGDKEGGGKHDENIEHGCTPYIPNAFTPNFDGVNDRFISYNDHENNCSIQVSWFSLYDRWGNLVYESSQANWDGYLENAHRIQEGLYIYKVTYDYSNDFGEVTNAHKIGSVHIIY